MKPEFTKSIIKEVRGKGFLIGLQLHFDQSNFIKSLEKNYLLTIRAAENVIRILPPLNVKKSEIDLALLETIDSKIVRPKSLRESPINMECVLYKIVDLPVANENEYNGDETSSAGTFYHMQPKYLRNNVTTTPKEVVIVSLSDYEGKVPENNSMKRRKVIKPMRINNKRTARK